MALSTLLSPRNDVQLSTISLGGNPRVDVQVPDYTLSTHDNTHLDPPPSYAVSTLSFSEAYKQWDSCMAASSQLEAFEDRYARLQEELAEMRKALSALQEQSAECFDNLRNITRAAKPASFWKPRRNKQSLLAEDGLARVPSNSTSSNGGHSTICAKSIFEKAHAEEMQMVLRVQSHEDALKDQKVKLDNLTAHASTGEECWLQLRLAVERMPSLGAMQLASPIGAALEVLNATDAAFGLAKAEETNLVRARRTIQHAHRYFTLALRICDDLHGGPAKPLPPVSNGATGMDGGNPPRKGMGNLDLRIKFHRGGRLFGRFGATMKVVDYQGAVKYSSMAQTCLNECLRVLEPYVGMIPAGLLADFQTLKRDGILQMVKVYNLVFGGRMIDSGVEEKIHGVLLKQETAFGCLTRFAVWVQERVPESELVARRACRRRDEGRRELADLWQASVRHGREDGEGRN